MPQEKWTMDQPEWENLKIDIENLRKNGVMTASGRFLIGMRFEMEKAQNREKYGRPRPKEAERYIAGELNIAQISVRRYARYARALETIRKERPDLAAELLSGRRMLSMRKVIEIAERKVAVPRPSLEKMAWDQNNFCGGRQFPVQEQCRPVPSVKDMPAYDPDAEFTGLALTVPSWTSSIKRAGGSADLQEVSPGAKAALQEEIQNMLRAIREE